MALLFGPRPVSGATGEVHSTQLNDLGTRALGKNGEEYIYLKGVGSTVLGSWVTYDETFATALLAANATGPVAVASAAIVADKFGWYCIKGVCSASIAASSADNAAILGREGADGVAGDGPAAGDAIVGAKQLEATTTAAVVSVLLSYPFVSNTA